MDRVEISLASVSKGSVSEVVAEADRLDEVAIQSEREPDIPCDAGDELHMKAATGEVVVASEAEDLCFARIARIRGKMQDLLDIANESGPPQAPAVGRTVDAAKRLVVVRPEGVDPSSRAIALHALA